jgi:hypothetical protein
VTIKNWIALAFAVAFEADGFLAPPSFTTEDPKLLIKAMMADGLWSIYVGDFAEEYAFLEQHVVAWRKEFNRKNDYTPGFLAQAIASYDASAAPNPPSSPEGMPAGFEVLYPAVLPPAPSAPQAAPGAPRKPRRVQRVIMPAPEPFNLNEEPEEKAGEPPANAPRFGARLLNWVRGAHEPVEESDLYASDSDDEPGNEGQEAPTQEELLLQAGALRDRDNRKYCRANNARTSTRCSKPFGRDPHQLCGVHRPLLGNKRQ